MDIRTEPSILNVDANVSSCPCCSNILQKDIKIGKYQIGDDCGYCRYLDRPFGGCGNTASVHYGDCSCEYGEKKYLYITCKKCLYPECVKCGVKCCCSGTGCNEIICWKCIKSEVFNTRWNDSSPQDKLTMYGIAKLRTLAKNKKIKGFSKYNKQELIYKLQSLVNENDFPIR